MKVKVIGWDFGFIYRVSYNFVQSALQPLHPHSNLRLGLSHLLIDETLPSFGLGLVYYIHRPLY